MNIIKHLLPGFSLFGHIGQGKSPDEFDQDRHHTDNHLIVVADGHGQDGNIIAQEIVDLMKIIKFNFNKEEFKNTILQAIFNKWETFPKNGGTTLTVVLFNDDQTRSLVFSLGDSPAIFNLPKDFEEDAQPLVVGAYQVKSQSSDNFHWTQVGQPSWWHSQHGYRLKTMPNHRFLSRRMLVTNGFKLGTIGVQPFAYQPEDDYQMFLTQSAVCEEVELLPGRRHVIGSDGMPIHKPEFWKIVKTGEDILEWMKKQYPQERDDFTMIMIE